MSKLSDAVKNDVVKKDVYNGEIKNIEDKIPDIINVATNAPLNAKINEIKTKYLQTFTKCLRLTQIFMWNSAWRGKFNFGFSRVFY